MRSFILVLGLVAVAVGRNLNDYRFIDPDLDWRVVGGAPGAPGQFPFIVSMRGPSGSHTCGGSIVSSRFILSAGHCVYGSSPSERLIVAGSHLLTSGGDLYTVDRILTNGYNPITVENDASLLQLSDEIVFGPTVATIQFARENVDEPRAVTLIGWGTTSYPGSIPDNVQYLTTLETISLADCQATWGASEVFTSNICTRGNAGYGACHGDSGGPLVDFEAGEQVGIVSWGAPCAVGYPDVYGRVSSFAPWIIATLEE